MMDQCPSSAFVISPYMGMQASRIAGRPRRIGGVPGGEPSGAGMRPNFPSQ